jgi:hypothetical protein
MRAKSKVSCIDARPQDSQPKHVAPKNPTLTYKSSKGVGLSCIDASICTQEVLAIE